MTMPEDGRNRRAVRSRAAIVDACKVAMMMGIFRPTMADICKAASLSVRTGFEHFGGIDAVLTAAIQDPVISKAILTAVLQDSLFPSGGDCSRIVSAAVFGRVM